MTWFSASLERSGHWGHFLAFLKETGTTENDVDVGNVKFMHHIQGTWGPRSKYLLSTTECIYSAEREKGDWICFLCLWSGPCSTFTKLWRLFLFHEAYYRFLGLGCTCKSSSHIERYSNPVDSRRRKPSDIDYSIFNAQALVYMFRRS